MGICDEADEEIGELVAEMYAPNESVTRQSLMAMLLGIGMVLTFSSNLVIYSALFLVPEIQPKHWLVAFGAGVAVVLMRPMGLKAPVFTPYTFALGMYACICLLAFVMGGGGDSQVLTQRLLGVLVAFLGFAAFQQNGKCLEAARIALACTALVSVAMNVYDITHPFSFLPLGSEFATVGRAAGLFINPNQSGAALVLAYALTIGIVRPHWKVFYFVLLAIGVLVTFSRGAILGFFLVNVVLVTHGKDISARQLIGGTLILAGCCVAGWVILADELQNVLGIDPSVALDRVFWLLDPTGRADDSQADRLMLAERGWALFNYSPFYGNGLGSTEYWELPESTHNMFLMLGNDFGIVGFLVVPVLLLAATWGALSRGAGTTTALFILFWSFLSHNVLTEYYLLISLSMAAALSLRTQTNNESC